MFSLRQSSYITSVSYSKYERKLFENFPFFQTSIFHFHNNITFLQISSIKHFSYLNRILRHMIRIIEIIKKEKNKEMKNIFQIEIITIN